MRRDTWRLQAESYPLHGEFQPRYIDVDIWQHLNNAALSSMQADGVQPAIVKAIRAAQQRAAELGAGG